MKYLQLVRFVNLIIIAATQIIFKFFLIDYYYSHTALNHVNFTLFVFATMCIAAAGYVINDIEDVAIDKINKPDKVIVGKTIGEKSANYLFILLNIIGMSIGFYLSYAVGKPNFAILFVFSSGLLYLYATRFKSILLVSNIIVSFLTAISIIIVGVFCIIPEYGNNPDYLSLNKYVFIYLLIYAGFAFLMNLLREITKDAEDMEGDRQHEINSIPLAIGFRKTGLLAGILTTVILAGVFALVYQYLFSYQWVVAYVFIAILTPLIYAAIKAFMAVKKENFTVLKHIYKIVMITGIISVYVIYKLVFTYSYVAG